MSSCRKSTARSSRRSSSVTRPDIKVLYVSGYSDNDIGDHGVVDSTIDLLQKPFTPQTLARKVRDVIEERVYAQTSA